MKKIKVVYTVQEEPFQYIHKEEEMELSDHFYLLCFCGGKEYPFAFRKCRKAENSLKAVLEGLSFLQGRTFSGIEDVVPCEEVKPYD